MTPLLPLCAEIERLKAQNKELAEAGNNVLLILQNFVPHPECYVAISVLKTLLAKYNEGK